MPEFEEQTSKRSSIGFVLTVTRSSVPVSFMTDASLSFEDATAAKRQYSQDDPLPSDLADLGNLDEQDDWNLDDLHPLPGSAYLDDV